MESKLIRPGLALALVAFTAATASAQVTEYTDEAAFNAATTRLTNYNFDGIVPANTPYEPGDVTVGGVTFTGGGGADFLFDANSGWAQYSASFFSGQSFNLGVDPSQVVCTLAGATALGFTFGDYADLPGGNPFTVTLGDGSSFLVTTPLNAGSDTGFVGFVSSVPITSVTFDNWGAAFDVIHFAEGSDATSVPEPGPLTLMATGLLFMAFLVRRRTAKVTRSS
jgi:hypothetical protein